MVRKGRNVPKLDLVRRRIEQPYTKSQVDALKRDWLTHWQACKAALERSDRETADAHFEVWAKARAALLAELGADGYRNWLLEVARQTLGSDAVCDRCRVPVAVSVIERDGRLWRRRACPECGERWLKPLDWLTGQ